MENDMTQSVTLGIWIGRPRSSGVHLFHKVLQMRPPIPSHRRNQKKQRDLERHE
ncbi:hypothetical protein SBA6_510021 [Candidatus Sulfopaludibacter sp. SbA6]|nr:hypothetical protein SBA6_510021 [Candidatus Sulfopaludibacter sp. SbA6]